MALLADMVRGQPCSTETMQLVKSCSQKDPSQSIKRQGNLHIVISCWLHWPSTAKLDENVALWQKQGAAFALLIRSCIPLLNSALRQALAAGAFGPGWHPSALAREHQPLAQQRQCSRSSWRSGGSTHSPTRHWTTSCPIRWCGC